MTHHLKDIAASGGRATYEKYGSEFMRLNANKRWAKYRANKKLEDEANRKEANAESA